MAPNDVYNRTLVQQTHPHDWVNPTPKDRYHLVVIGAGTAGLTAAAGCAAIGGRAPNVEGLNLEAVGVVYDKRGVTGNDWLQTTNMPGIC